VVGRGIGGEDRRLCRYNRSREGLSGRGLLTQEVSMKNSKEGDGILWGRWPGAAVA